jgi:3-hydroxyisobutyrate dehydrogenase
VVTNYLCSVHLAALAEALTVCAVAGLDLNTAYEAIRISSGNSFVQETDSQVILNGSRDINFTMDLVIKDLGLFDKLGSDHHVPLELSPLVLDIFRDGSSAMDRASFRPMSSAASRMPARSGSSAGVSRRRSPTMSLNSAATKWWRAAGEAPG